MPELFENSWVKKLVRLYADIWSVEHAVSLLDWDLNTYMPRGAVEDRGFALARLEALKQKAFLSPEFREALRKAEESEGLNDYEKGVVRVLRRRLDYYERVPPELVEEEKKVTTRARVAWEQAKAKADFSLFREHFERVVDVERRIAERLAEGKNLGLYDALLDLYEEGFTSSDVDRVFGELRRRLPALFRKILDSGLYPQHHPLEDQQYDASAVHHLNLVVLGYLGYDWSRGRLDTSAHPFTIEMGIDDVRITTWYHGKDFRRSLGAVVHEFGHAIYELQIDRRLARTPLARGVSMGIHESQSRFWENLVWRTRAFAEFFMPAMRGLLPFLRDYSAEDVYKYFAIVRPEYIRVEADEVHYPLHVILRYEIEKALVEDSLKVDEVPQVWNEKMEQYIGINPPNDALGCLQDVHWSSGYIGYFPTYAIGSILAVQFAKTLERELEPLEAIISRGGFSEIRRWLGEKVHRWGATYPPKELVKRVTGEEINPSYFVEYLEQKYLKA